MDTRGDLYFKLNQSAPNLFDLIKTYRVLHIAHNDETCFCGLYMSGILDEACVEDLDATAGYVLLCRNADVETLRKTFDVIETGDGFGIVAGYYSRPATTNIIKPEIIPPPPTAVQPPRVHSEIDRTGCQYLILNDRLSMVERAEVFQDYYIEAVVYKDQPKTAIILERERGEPKPEDLDEEEVDDIYFITGINPTDPKLQIFQDFMEAPEPCLLFAVNAPDVYINFLSYTFEVIEVVVEGVVRKAILYGVFQ